MKINVLGTKLRLKTYKRKKSCPKDLRVFAGYYDPSGETIYLNLWQMTSERQVLNTLLHEVVHAIDTMTTCPDSRLAHRDIYRISQGLETFLCNNKSLLLEMLEGE